MFEKNKIQHKDDSTKPSFRHARSDSEKKDDTISFSGEMKSTVQTFAQSTSIKGIPKAMKTDSLLLKCIWIIGTFIGLGVALFLLLLITLAYFRYDTVIEIDNCVDYNDDGSCMGGTWSVTTSMLDGSRHLLRSEQAWPPARPLRQFNSFCGSP